MNIIVNGKNVECNGKIVTISTVMKQLELPHAGVAIAIGNAVVPKTQWDDYILNEGVKITVIKATQGG